MVTLASDDKYPRALVAVDVAAFTVLESELQVLLIRRGLPPTAHLALPGGFVRCGDATSSAPGESLDDAAARELREETGMPGVVRLTQVAVRGAPDRDARARVVSIAYLAVVRPEIAAYVRAGSDAAGVVWMRVAALSDMPLAFDHSAIVDAALQRLRDDVDETDVARELVPRVFSLAELRAAVDAVHGTRADPANFRRRMKALEDGGVIARVPGQRVTGKRPAAVFRFVDA